MGTHGTDSGSDPEEEDGSELASSASGRSLRDRVRSLWKNSVIAGSLKYSSVKVSTKTIGFLLLPVWTHFLTKEDFGVVGTMMAYSSLLVPFVALGLPAAMVRHFHSSKGEDERDWATYFSSNLYFVVGIGVTLMTVGLVLGSFFWVDLISSEIAFNPFVILALVTVPFIVVLQLVQANFRAQQRHGAAVTIELGRYLTFVTIGLVLVTGFKMGPAGYMTATLCAVVISVCGVAVGPLRDWLVPRFHWADVRSALRFGLPLVPHVIAGIVFSVSDRVMLEKIRGLGEVGIYNLAFHFSQLMSFLVLAVNQAWSPRHYQIMNARETSDPEPRLKRYACWWFGIFGVICGSIALFGREAVMLLTPVDYHGAGQVIPFLVLGAFFQGIYFFGANSLFFARRTFLIPILTGVAAVANIGLNLLLIPRFGELGAASATLATFLLVAVIANVAGLRTFRVSYSFGWLGLVVAAVVGTTVLSFFLEVGTLGGLLVKGACLVVLATVMLVFLTSQGMLTLWGLTGKPNGE